MSTERYVLEIEGLRVEVRRKPIKNLHLSVYPPDGQVRVSAPEYLGDEAIRLAVIDKLGWIRRQQAKFQAQPRQSRREMVSGESHYFQGRRYLLEVIEADAPPVVQVNHRKLVLRVRPGTDRDKREAILYRWYRRQLKAQIPPLIAKWEPVIGVQVAEWGVKRMKTRWGTCNIEARRIWLNLELVKKPPRCLEYVLVHEMVHLLERHHNERFRALMSRFLPQWRFYRDELNSEPLAHENWTY
ncbi:M48 family peptidase [Candidatus Parcubacteria bacterium]|nr:MAG: M48 family peptidase [Candidatus Parcubacteria bacterium]